METNWPTMLAPTSYKWVYKLYVLNDLINKWGDFTPIMGMGDRAQLVHQISKSPCQLIIMAGQLTPP